MRDELLLLQMRPVLPLDSSQSGPDERFQNQTLRPILKMLHPLLVQVFRSQLQKHGEAYRRLAKPERLAWIAQRLRTDPQLRHLLAGMVVGQFTASEYRQFTENEAERMRRLQALLLQRLQSEADAFLPEGEISGLGKDR